MLVLAGEFKEDDVIEDIGHLAQLGGEAVCYPEEEAIHHPHIVGISDDHLPDAAQCSSHSLPLHFSLTQRAHHQKQRIGQQRAAIFALFPPSLLPQYFSPKAR